MVCNIYNQSLEKIAALTEFESLMWEEGYISAGAFQVVARKSDVTASAFKAGNFVGVPQLSSTLMVIRSVEDKDGQMWAIGSESKTILSNRVHEGTAVCGVVEKSLKEIIASQRPFPIVAVEPIKGLTEKRRMQSTYGDLFTISQNWCDAVGYGFRMVHDRTNKKLMYSVYEGKSTGYKASENIGNIANIYRAESENGWKNVAYVAGAGDGADRIVVLCGDVNSEGLERREMYVDARDIQPDGMTDSEYREALTDRGFEKLAESARVEELDFEILGNDYGRLFGLGDKITCVLRGIGVKLEVKVMTAKTVVEGNQITTTITVGNPVRRL